MLGREPGRRPASRAAIVVLLLLAAVAFVFGAGIVDAVTGYNSFRLPSLSQGLEDATPLLLLAAVLLSGPALGERHRWILAGAGLAALGAAGSQVLLGWFLGPNGPFSTATDAEAILSVYTPLNLTAHAVSAAGWVLLAWGVGLGGFRVRPGTGRLILLAVVALATGAYAASLTIVFFTPVTTPDQTSAFVAVGLTLATVVARGTAALTTLATARPGPPLDWRWPVGLGLGVAQVAGAIFEWALIASAPDGYSRWWASPAYAAAVVGGLIAVAGFAIASAVRWPVVPPSTGSEEVPAIGS